MAPLNYSTHLKTAHHLFKRQDGEDTAIIVVVSLLFGLPALFVLVFLVVFICECCRDKRKAKLHGITPKQYEAARLHYDGIEDRQKQERLRKEEEEKKRQEEFIKRAEGDVDEALEIPKKAYHTDV